MVDGLLRQTTSFVGREQDIHDIMERISTPYCQLMTLVGPGGIGKTRLAMEVAQCIADRYTHGVYFVALQPLESPAYIAPAILNTLGLPTYEKNDPVEHLRRFLQDRQLLLIIDNFEHLIAGAELLVTLLTNAPDMKMLVTSREALNLREEWLWTVRGLSYPSTIPHGQAGDYSALRLFAERACQIHPDFSLNDHVAAVTRICQLVEGVPLAIEMAANWLKALSPDAIVDAIQSSIDFLTSRYHNIPERHRTMRAVYNHSWSLLSDEERRVFMKLSVFRGGFSAAAAISVTGTSLATLATLVDKSFVRQYPNGRCDIHEQLRQYAAGHLEQTGGYECTADDHAAYFAALVIDCKPVLRNTGQLDALNLIEANFENIRAAWSRKVIQHDGETINAMIDSLELFGGWRSRFVEVLELFEMAAAELNDYPVGIRLNVRATNRSLDIIEQALTTAQLCGDDEETAYCLNTRGVYYAQRHQHTLAFQDHQAAIALYDAAGDHYGVMVAVHSLNFNAMAAGDLEASRQYTDQGLRLARQHGTPAHLYRFLFFAGWSDCFDGQYNTSERYLREALKIAQEMNFPMMAADCLGSLAFLAFLRGDLRQAREWVLDDLENVSQVKAVGEVGFAKIVLAHITCLEENYDEAQRLAEDALVLVRPQPIREAFILRVMALIACGVGKYEQAREYAIKALTGERQRGVQTWILPVFAILLDHDGNTESAAELIGLLFTHPASATGWLDKWTPMNDLRTRLLERMGTSAYDTAWERGTTLELTAVVEEHTSGTPKQPLIEPLTERELEVLRLVAAGLSNHEIADALTVTEGTVRTHIYNFCQKLNARSRTHAVARARLLHILH